MIKINLKCPSCGSDNVWRDALARWSFECQEWVLDCTYDDMGCSDCQDEFKACTEETVEVGNDLYPDEQSVPRVRLDEAVRQLSKARDAIATFRGECEAKVYTDTEAIWDLVNEIEHAMGLVERSWNNDTDDSTTATSHNTEAEASA
ncbi:MAG: hypothetical protein AAGI44_05285 [Pseudomonadota bacterium]